MKKYIVVIAYVCVTLFCLYELQLLITQPRQYQFLARQLDTVEVQIRAIETNPEGDEFRWLSDDVTITVPKPTQTGVVHMHVWIAPGRITTAIQVGNYQLSTPLFSAFQSRRIALLVTPSATQSSLLPIKFIFKPN